MPEIAIVSDTHIPSRAERVPEWVGERVRAADHTIHAGDFDSRDAYESVADLAGDLTAVTGNMDPALDLPATTTVTLGGVTFVVTHGTGDIETYDERVEETVREHAGDGLTVGVSGHTHQATDREAGDLRLLNPGSATGADPASEETMMTATVEDGDCEVTLHRE